MAMGIYKSTKHTFKRIDLFKHNISLNKVSVDKDTNHRKYASEQGSCLSGFCSLLFVTAVTLLLVVRILESFGSGEKDSINSFISLDSFGNQTLGQLNLSESDMLTTVSFSLSPIKNKDLRDILMIDKSTGNPKALDNYFEVVVTNRYKNNTGFPWMGPSEYFHTFNKYRVCTSKIMETYKAEWFDEDMEYHLCPPAKSELKNLNYDRARMYQLFKGTKKLYNYFDKPQVLILKCNKEMN
jgi:hypothetical protein